jgi:hypothetical protein
VPDVEFGIRVVIEVELEIVVGIRIECGEE